MRRALNEVMTMCRYMIALTAMIALMCAGCSQKPASISYTNAVTQNAGNGTVGVQQEHKHRTAHGGSLNAIVTCENGHAEIKLDGDMMHLWFVGGGPNTDRSVRVPDTSITLRVQTTRSEQRLILKPKPLELAGEKIGDCSYFEGSGHWLIGLAKFSAQGQIAFKGERVMLRIKYPDGYDPD